MAKVFEFDARKGSYIDQVSGEAGTNNNGKFVRSDKGLAWEGNGEDSYITMPSSITISNNYSIEWWDQLYNEDYLGVLGLSSSPLTSYIRHGGGPGETYSNILIETDTDSDVITIDFNSNISKKFNHFVLNIDDEGLVKLYLNGVLQDDSGTITDDLTVDIIGLGRNTDYLNGFLSRLQIYDHILTSKEISKLYKEFQNSHPITTETNENIAISKPTDLSHEEGLVAAYNMKPNGDSLVDISGNGKNLDINNAISTKDGMYFSLYNSNATGELEEGGSEKTICTKMIRYEADSPNRFIIEGDCQIGFSSNNIYVHVSSSNGDDINIIFEDVNINLKEEFTLVVTIDLNSIITVYLNGNKITEESLINSKDGVFTGSTFYLGYNINDQSANGEIHDYKRYNRILSEQEIKDYHNKWEKVEHYNKLSDLGVGTIS